MSPFDICKSLTQTKDNICDIESVFNKEYVPFMINRILSNSPSTVLFANAINQNGVLDKKLQYDFYRLGIPKTKSYSKWVKKESIENQEHLDFICTNMQVSLQKAIELYKIIGSSAIIAEMSKFGGKMSNK